MCGIIGYAGHQNATELIVDGLRRLRYRGYDSAGIAIQNGKGVEIRRTKGRISALEELLAKKPMRGTTSIGHTRWATHGAPSDENAHPHKFGSIVVVHNGIIENYQSLRDRLKKQGHQFSSETDTEITAHLVEEQLRRGKGKASLVDAVREALRQVRGAYALAVMCETMPGQIVVAKNASPLIVGKGKGENFVASDIPAILSHTQEMVFLEDGEMAIVTPDSVTFRSLDTGKSLRKRSKTITWSAAVAEKDGYRHFMLKEIHEQPTALIDTFRGRLLPEKGIVDLGMPGLKKEFINNLEKVAVIACGTAYHAGLVGKFYLESFAGVSTEVDVASEFRYRDPILNRRTLLIPISQSGETADTLAAQEEGIRKGALSLAITNTVESSVARKASRVFYTHAGPEIGVASTKCFLVQLIAMYMIALYLGRQRGRLKAKDVTRLSEPLLHLPSLVQDVLKSSDAVLDLAKKYAHLKDYFYLGRGINYPIALEGALKLKEIAYINTQAYAAGEMKHGPIALIDEEWPVVAILPKCGIYEKILSNVEEVKSRGGRILAIATKGDADAFHVADEVVEIPKCDELLTPFLTSVVLQLFAYHMAVLRGTDVDQPRNLAKSVTVE